MILTLEQVKKELLHDEFHVTVGNLDLSIGYPSEDFADVMTATKQGDVSSKFFEGYNALPRAVAYANAILRKY